MRMQSPNKTDGKCGNRDQWSRLVHFANNNFKIKQKSFYTISLDNLSQITNLACLIQHRPFHIIERLLSRNPDRHIRVLRLSPRQMKSEYLVLVIFLTDSFANPIQISDHKASAVGGNSCDLVRFRQSGSPSWSNTCLNGVLQTKSGTVPSEFRYYTADTAASAKRVSLRLRGGGSGQILIKTLTGESFRCMKYVKLALSCLC
jgi:hypothetical protein